MGTRHRAVLAEDKEERHQDILAAAQRLLLRAPERELNMAEVADEVGLAKGTVYLYFAGKDELLVALHERNVAGFFTALVQRLDQPQPVAVEEVVALVHTHLLTVPLYLPLASRCMGVMAQGTADIGRAFKQRMAERMQRAGTGLEQHFPALGPGDGMALLRHSYATILGLWQLSLQHAAGVGMSPNPDPNPNPNPNRVEGCAGAAPDFAADLDRALRALWRGALAVTPAAVAAS